ncbi:MAG: AsmA-like C-terminal region-containing protein [Rickettsia endosymbiont of Bryobia graminum]|nr:AsmA-like C-terminal region-containing protein [Rickettsia endosymbiont of Bryobia graminum]
MIIIKNFFLNLSVVLSSIIIILCFLILSASSGYLDTPIKKGLEYYFHKKDIKIKIGNLHIKNNILSIDKIFMNLENDAKGEITNLKISFTINNIIKSLLIFNVINADNFVIISENNQPVIDTKISATQMVDLLENKLEAKIDLDPIQNIALTSSKNNLQKGAGFCSYKAKFLNSNKSLECELIFDNQANLLFNSSINDNLVKVHADITNIPIMIYQIVSELIPNNKIIVFLQEHIKNGHITKGKLDLNLDTDSLQNEISKEAISGKFNIIDLDYKYDKDFPTLQKINTDVIIEGPQVNFILNQAYSGNSLISGLITFKWQGKLEDSYVTFNATAKGQALDLIDFISDKNYQDTKNQGIDLKKILGQANTKINISIPTNPNINNNYDISTVITSAELKAFNENVTLKNAKIDGLFDGNKVILNGVGKINDNTSNFVYQYNNIDNESLLKIKSTILARQQEIGMIKLISGSSNLDFEYKQQFGKKPFLKVTSNLKNLEFYIDKISIYKKINKNANLTLVGNLEDSQNGYIDFNLSGDDNLKILGKVKSQNNKYNINLQTIKHNDTNVSGKLSLDKDNLSAEISGSSLDLSNSQMMQFLEKESDKRNTHLKVNINKIKLKNNIFLDDFNLTVDCNKIKCFSGFLSSSIGTKSLKMTLTDKQDLEQWIITCGDAGALFKGLGMYNNMRSGSINLILETKRHEVKKGHIVPILDGSFDFQHFYVTDMSFLTRIVSFVSLPGFVSLIVNNKDIAFTNMNGKFNYIGTNITITNAQAQGPFFDFTMKGTINTNTRQIKLKGNVIPSFFFASAIITKIPVVGKIFSKVAPYNVELYYNE